MCGMGILKDGAVTVAGVDSGGSNGYGYSDGDDDDSVSGCAEPEPPWDGGPKRGRGGGEKKEKRPKKERGLDFACLQWEDERSRLSTGARREI